VTSLPSIMHLTSRHSGGASGVAGSPTVATN
jgi:hypothetical protein